MKTKSTDPKCHESLLRPKSVRVSISNIFFFQNLKKGLEKRRDYYVYLEKKLIKSFGTLNSLTLLQ